MDVCVRDSRSQATLVVVQHRRSDTRPAAGTERISDIQQGLATCKWKYQREITIALNVSRATVTRGVHLAEATDVWKAGRARRKVLEARQDSASSADVMKTRGGAAVRIGRIGLVLTLGQTPWWPLSVSAHCLMESETGNVTRYPTRTYRLQFSSAQRGISLETP